MPKGMMLKSDGFASDIYDPQGSLTLKKFCAERGVPYADTGKPVLLDTFCAYGVAFRERMVPNLEETNVAYVERIAGGFRAHLENGETAEGRRLVLAVGITHFENIPETLVHLPAQYFSHSSVHREVATHRGRKVVIIGAGASALDLAGLMHDAGVDIELVSRKPEISFHSAPTGKKRSWWQRLTRPSSGLGPGLKSRFFAESPLAFHYLPENLRIESVQKALGPSGGYFIKNKVVGKVPMHLGYLPDGAEVRDGKVRLTLRATDGATKEIVADHIIAGTGYRVSLDSLRFLSEDLRSMVQQANGFPVLSVNFESSVPGLYFTGLASANSFGPVMRFAFGAKFTARRLAKVLKKTALREPLAMSAVEVAVNTK
jgi:thioredoxin reductase